MKLGDMVVLKENKSEYLKQGIKKEDCIGGIYADQKENEKWNVIFINKDKIIGEFLIKECDLELWKDPSVKKALSFDGDIIPNYAAVELINDKAEYKRQGATKGMRGLVIEVFKNGGFQVDFSQGIEKQIYCAVEGNDLKIINE